MNDWELIRFTTLDELITMTKLHGSALTLNGYTTPERYPFVVTISVASPGNEEVLQFAQEYVDKLNAVAPAKAAINPRVQ